MTPTQPTPPTPPPGPPPTPPPGPPPSPGAAPAKKSGGGTVWMILFIVAAVLFVGALVFAIISFTGKNAEADDKEKAEQELASTQRELEQTREQLGSTEEELGTQQGAGEILGDLVRTGEASANDLKACADSARQLRSNIVAALNAVQAGTGINSLVDGINAQIQENDRVCGTSDQSYQDFANALQQLREE